MAILKCKMCGGALDISGNETVAICGYCGTKQTLPRLADERKADLYDRANHFRRNNDFDKAMQIYESILNDDKTDAESYWSLVLCRYGIEYVKDPATQRRIPTVNRAQFTSVFMDENYKSALQYADANQRAVYEAEAKAIDDIQKNILEISQKEEPFDVFICYKETDADGRRTMDSVLATELYHELCKEGFKVFFARITLEDKLGTAYEPYIFAALNSAKVMVVLGTKQENFNAVWVKNEWSRYLALIKNGAPKTLIPAYKDMLPYDLPDEFSHLQAQDMSKLGFMQDLVRGIRKIAGAEKTAASQEMPAVSAPVASAAPLLKRAFIFLEDGDFERADQFCEQVLNIDPENADAYIGKLMVECRTCKREDLKRFSVPFNTSNNFSKAIRFGGKAVEDELWGYIKFINERNELARLNAAYEQAAEKMAQASVEAQFKEAAALFGNIADFKDAKTQAELCLQYAKEKAEADRINRKKRKKRTKKIIISVVSSYVALTAFVLLMLNVIIPSVDYKKATKLYNSGDRVQAAIMFGKAGGYSDAREKSFDIWGEIATRETVSAGDYHTVALKSDGTVVAVGDNDDGQCDVDGWTDIVAVSAGYRHTLGLKSDGTVVATEYTGDSSYNHGQCDVDGWKVKLPENAR